jgi:glycosyltransferase involved in cell wall biosynthesis
MLSITALLHTSNDGLRLGRALETLLPCAEILIVDHSSSDATRRVAREYGATVVSAAAVPASHYLNLARCDWIFCLDPAESMTEGLQTSLFEWCSRPDPGADAFSVSVRLQVAEDWETLPLSETRLVPRGWTSWRGGLPADQPSARVLEGELLRLAFP